MNNYPPGVTADDIDIHAPDYGIDEPATRSDNLPSASVIQAAINRSKKADTATGPETPYGVWCSYLGPTAQRMDTRWLMDKYKYGWTPTQVDDRIRDYSD